MNIFRNGDSETEEKTYRALCKQLKDSLDGQMKNQETKVSAAVCFKEICRRFAGRHIPDRWSCYEELEQPENVHVYYPHRLSSNAGTLDAVFMVSHNLSRTGAPLALLEAVHLLSEKGYTVVVAASAAGDLLPEFIRAGAYCMIIPKLDDRTEFPREILEKIIHDFSFLFVNTAVMHHIVSFADTRNISVLWWMHEGIEILRQMQCLDSMPKRVGENVRPVCVSKFLCRELKQAGFDYSFTVCPCGMEVPEAVGETDKKKNEKVRFVTAGTLCYGKGYDILLEAIGSLPKEQLEQAEFILAGKPEDDSVYRRIKEAAGSYPVTYAGELKKDEICRLYQSCDVCIVPSRSETLSLAAVENMAYGNVCICSSETGIADYIRNGENGFVFLNEQVKELSSAIAFVIEHPDKRQKWAAEAKLLYQMNFSKESFSARLGKLVKEVSGRNNRVRKNTKADIGSSEKGNFADYADRYFALDNRMNLILKDAELERKNKINSDYIRWAKEEMDNLHQVIKGKDGTIEWAKQEISNLNGIVEWKDEQIRLLNEYKEKLEKEMGKQLELEAELTRQASDLTYYKEHSQALEEIVKVREEKIRQTNDWAAMLEDALRQKDEQIKQLVESRLNYRLKKRVRVVLASFRHKDKG